MNAWLVETESASVYASKAVAWDSEDHLELALPFQDLKPTVYLGEIYALSMATTKTSESLSDPFLPRVCELASTSSDRQTKVRKSREDTFVSIYTMLLHVLISHCGCIFTVSVIVLLFSSGCCM